MCFDSIFIDVSAVAETAKSEICFIVYIHLFDTNATGAQILRGNNLQEETAFLLFHLRTGHLLQGGVGWCKWGGGHSFFGS